MFKQLVAIDGAAVRDLELPDIRTRILDATRAAIGQNGFSGVIIDQIAAGAKVGVATVYRYFGDREKLSFVEELRISGRSLLAFFPILLPAFLLMGFTEVLLPPEIVENGLSETSGWSGIAVDWLARINP